MLRPQVVKSPNVDRLAKRGVRFERAYCQYPLCGPSRASFMTGLYPDQTLIRRNAIRLRTKLPGSAEPVADVSQSGLHRTRVGKIYHYNVPKPILATGGHDDPYSWDFRSSIHVDEMSRPMRPLIFSLRPGSFGGTLSWLAADASDRRTDRWDRCDRSHSMLLKQYAQDDEVALLSSRGTSTDPTRPTWRRRSTFRHLSNRWTRSSCPRRSGWLS